MKIVYWWVILVGLSVATMHVTVSVAIMQLEVSPALMQVTAFAFNMWVTIFIVFSQVGVSVAVMQVVLFAVHNSFCCKMQVTVSVIAMPPTLTSNSFIFLSLNGTHFS